LVNTNSTLGGSLWSHFDVLGVTATDTSAHALLNWVSATIANPFTAVGTIPFTAAGGGSCGFASSGTGSYINTGFNPTTAVSPNFVLNSASFGIWDNAAGAGDSTAAHNVFGTISNNALINFLELTVSGAASIEFNSVFGPTNPPNTVAAGLYSGSLIGSTALALYKNGSALGIGTPAGTQAVVNDSFTFPYGAFASTDPICAFWIGSKFSATDETVIYGLLHTYMQNVAGLP
jgi:hypothetical protein